MTRIVIGNDHAAVAMKNEIKSMLESKGYEVINVGTDTNDSVDYPEFGQKAAMAVVNHEADFGIVICGTGIGISIAANKVPGIRCGLCKDVTDARLTREHNDANMLAMGARTTGLETAKDIVETFLNTPFSQGVNHIRRIEKLAKIDGSFKGE
ncbi:ribose 5-phosphate isomerase B [Allobaculum stercoricanis]|uniref:ribose 5-phosphate isomerase B n=1 Tax=Allobaculum stercoricanis TaxID=174709 RepID=UPI00035FA4AD|nr:ribose 5-phosphate isomerase B [Allobaculum stercoricanis]